MDITQPPSEKGDFFSLDVQTLRLDATTNFPLYMKRGKGKPVLYRGADTQFTGAILDNLRRNDVTSLFVPSECWDEYRDYLADNLADLADDPSVPTETKCEVAYEAATTVMEEMFAGPPKEEDLKKATKKIFEPMTKVMVGSNDAIKKLVALTSKDSALYAKSVNVCLLGMLMVRKILGIAEPKRLMEIGTGFLLCDISKLNWPDEILRRRGTLLPEEWEIVKQHPQESLDMLKDVPLSDEAKIIILQHHERADGSGYPKGLKGNKIHTLATIASFADAFAALNSERPFADARITYDALHVIKSEMLAHVDTELFAQFVQLFSAGNPLKTVSMEEPVSKEEPPSK